MQDYYICKLTSCQTMIMFENCGARSKILNHYTSHFQVVIHWQTIFSTLAKSSKHIFDFCQFFKKKYFQLLQTLQRELEDQFGHLLTDDMQCTMCGKQLGNYIKSKVILSHCQRVHC